MQQPTQRQQLQDQLEHLEFQQRILQRKIIQNQVKLELLIQKENRERELPTQSNYIQSTPQNQQRTNTNQSTNDSNSSSSEENNSDEENNQSSDSQDSNKDEDSDADLDERDPFRLPDGQIIYSGDTVNILNPSNENEERGVIIGSTPKRLRIELENGVIILRQADNLAIENDTNSTE